MLDPHVEQVLRLTARAEAQAIERGRIAHYWQMPVEQARLAYTKAAPILEIAPRQVHVCENFTITRPDGSALPVRFYWPCEPSANDPMPALVFFHGGGFTVGSVDTHDAITRMFCMEVPCAVLSVGYRLAPEHPFPAAYEDAWLAVQWIFQQAEALHIAPKKIALGGDSAGGTLAAACSIAAVNASLPISMQLLIYPGTCAHQDTGSHLKYAQGYLLTRDNILWFFRQYLKNDRDRTDWRFAPLEWAQQVSSTQDLAPAWVALAEYDPLVDEGIAYATCLQSKGTQVELKLYQGMIHAFFNMGGFVKAARQAHQDAVNALQRVWKLTA
jgi:acetyl esterase